MRGVDVATVPARLHVIGEIAAGRPFERSLHGGKRLRIFTGGVVPDGADTVVIQEEHRRATATCHRQGSVARRRKYALPASIFAKATSCYAPAAISPTATCPSLPA